MKIKIDERKKEMKGRKIMHEVWGGRGERKKEIDEKEATLNGYENAAYEKKYMRN